MIINPERKNRCLRRCLGEFEEYVERPREEWEIRHIALLFDILDNLSNNLKARISEEVEYEESKSTSEIQDL